ncbi:MAG: hypothetical protein ACE5FI_18435 [Anaerolineales bacterium]
MKRGLSEAYTEIKEVTARRRERAGNNDDWRMAGVFRRLVMPRRSETQSVWNTPSGSPSRSMLRASPPPGGWVIAVTVTWLDSGPRAIFLVSVF